MQSYQRINSIVFGDNYGMQEFNVTGSIDCQVNRVKAFSLKTGRSDFAKKRVYMKKLKDYPLEEYSVNYNYVLRQIERLENKNLSFDEKSLLNLLKCKIKNVESYSLSVFNTRLLNEVFMTIVKLNTQKTAL